MKNTNMLLICFLLLSVSVTGSCSKKTHAITNSISSTDTLENNSTDVTTPNPNADSEEVRRTFTMEELKQYNGQNDNPAYVAVNGLVYDVTNVRSWKNGTHQGLSAGMDLTNELANSPHGDVVLKNLPIVGTLENNLS